MLSLTKECVMMLAILSALVLAAMLGVYLPQGRQLESLASDAALERQQMESNNAKAAMVPKMVREISELKARYTNLDRRLPKQKELAGFLREISENLAQERLHNQTIEPGSPNREDLFHTLPIIMRFDGSYPSLANFLMRIDGMERLTRVQKLLIAPDVSSKDREGQDLKIELQMNIYFTES